MTKEAIRKIYKEKRKYISRKDRELWTDLILINFQKINLPFLNCIHTYLAIENQNEVDTHNIVRFLKFRNPEIKIVVPKINLNADDMQHYIFEDDMELTQNSFGIVEPVKGQVVNANTVDLVLTPLLAFDKRGYRVGYGKGFYDKFFQQCKQDVIRVGISFYEPEEIIDDINSYDIPLHYCITPKFVYTF